jgi:hypothetical protein
VHYWRAQPAENSMKIFFENQSTGLVHHWVIGFAVGGDLNHEYIVRCVMKSSLFIVLWIAFLSLPLCAPELSTAQAIQKQMPKMTAMIPCKYETTERGPDVTVLYKNCEWEGAL